MLLAGLLCGLFLWPVAWACPIGNVAEAEIRVSASLRFIQFLSEAR